VRIYLTGASGFVGSNFTYVFGERHGAEVIAPSHDVVDLTDASLVTRSVLATLPDAIVHTAIWNDPAGLMSDRRRAWDAYVGATRNVVDAANRAHAHVVLISTDWVFDGIDAPVNESEPPHPINTYGFLKASSELVVTERASTGTVARIAGVQGRHRARASLPRSQDSGFGYFVASLVDALRAGRRFTVWDGPQLNQLATPTLATDAGEMVWRALERGVTGVLHCCGGEHVSRQDLAHRAAAAFALDDELIDTGPPPPEAIGPEAVPRDTRLDAQATASALGLELPELDETLARLRVELEEEAI
jgi:dTDP-4-dehydrorhamnose reductase